MECRKGSEACSHGSSLHYVLCTGHSSWSQSDATNHTESITARLHGIVTHSSHIHFMKADLGTPELQGLGLLLLAVTTVSWQGKHFWGSRWHDWRFVFRTRSDFTSPRLTPATPRNQSWYRGREEDRWNFRFSQVSSNIRTSKYGN